MADRLMTKSVLRRVINRFKRGRSEKLQPWLGHCDILEVVETSQVCPICKLTLNAVEKYLDSYLYENVNDPCIRSDLRQARGFCADHAWKMLHTHTGTLGVAITYQDMVVTLRTALENEQGRVRSAFRSRFWLPQKMARDAHKILGEFVDQLQGKGQCPACRHAEEIEDMYIFFALQLLDDDDVASRVAGRLCIRHFCLAVKQIRNQHHLNILIAQQLAQLQHLETDLAEFIRKNDYRFTHEGFGSEGDSWRRATLHVSGVPASSSAKDL